MVDGVPYRHSSASAEGSTRRVKEMRGQMVLRLAAGSHTAQLQWEALGDSSTNSDGTPGPVSWTVLNSIGNSFMVRSRFVEHKALILIANLPT